MFLRLNVLALGLWALQTTAAPQHGGPDPHDPLHGGGVHGGGWGPGGDIGGDGYTRGHNHKLPTSASVDSCNVILHPGVTERKPCYTVTETVSPTTCRPIHCPLIPHLVCPMIVKVTTTEVPCSNDCCPVTPTQYVTGTCAGCATTCVIPTETLTFTTGCAKTTPFSLHSSSTGPTGLPTLTVPTVVPTLPGGSLPPTVSSLSLLTAPPSLPTLPSEPETSVLNFTLPHLTGKPIPPPLTL